MDTLDNALRDLVAYRLRRATVAVMGAFNEVFSEFGLRRTTFSALTLIVDNPGLRQSQLADALAIERPNIVQIVDELERAGLVRRAADRQDRRAHALKPTKAGRALSEKAMARAHACDAALLDGLTPEQIGALVHTLQIIRSNAETPEIPHAHDVSRA